MVKELTEHVCLNCSTVNPPENKFCGQCGQKMEIHRISAHEITHDAVHYFTHADKGIFYLIKKLATKPGVVAREYLAGKRTQYFKPLNFLLIVAALVVFMTSMFNSGSMQSSNGRTRAIQSANISEEQKQMYLKRWATVDKITSKYTNVINMLATPLLAFVIFLFYLKKPYSYLEHLVANMYFVGMIMIFYALIVVPITYFSHSASIGRMMIGIFFIVEIVYRGIAYYQLMNQKGTKYMLKAIGVSLIASIVWGMLSYFLIYFYVRNGLGGIFS